MVESLSLGYFICEVDTHLAEMILSEMFCFKQGVGLDNPARFLSALFFYASIKKTKICRASITQHVTFGNLYGLKFS